MISKHSDMNQAILKARKLNEPVQENNSNLMIKEDDHEEHQQESAQTKQKIYSFHRNRNGKGSFKSYLHQRNIKVIEELQSYTSTKDSIDITSLNKSPRNRDERKVNHHRINQLSQPKRINNYMIKAGIRTSMEKSSTRPELLNSPRNMSGIYDTWTKKNSLKPNRTLFSKQRARKRQNAVHHATMAFV
ncbi:unnamed protein product [Moneuplotes crassus]|uniref:Uncharacterized protein n=1 Tax=Euplotes crassus TaxID=5936 RepID=A0AAD1XCN4_EUPCR|nr:unnamed protein product [Moneuplotes crassus]